MFRPLIILRKYLFTKPKWRILRIYTKQISRSKLETLRGAILEEMKSGDANVDYLSGKVEILNLLLK
jgi:hypothetical protein